jgi:hypothetical protein
MRLLQSLKKLLRNDGSKTAQTQRSEPHCERRAGKLVNRKERSAANVIASEAWQTHECKLPT